MDATALAHATSSRFIRPSSLHSAGTSTDAAAVADGAPPPLPFPDHALAAPPLASRTGPKDTAGRDDLASRAMADDLN